MARSTLGRHVMIAAACDLLKRNLSVAPRDHSISPWWSSEAVSRAVRLLGRLAVRLKVRLLLRLAVRLKEMRLVKLMVRLVLRLEVKLATRLVERWRESRREWRQVERGPSRWYASS